MSKKLFERYKESLSHISARTGASVPSLFASFIVLHEATAILPFIGVFYASRALGVGETVVSAVLDDDDNSSESTWIRDKTRQWVTEGGDMAQRVGTRYGIFGFEKRPQGQVSEGDVVPSPSITGNKIVGDVANVIVAYSAVKVRLLAKYLWIRGVSLGC
jgi:hypothetical protein